MNTGSEDEIEQKRIRLQQRFGVSEMPTQWYDSFLTEEYKDDWGHSKMEDALRLGARPIRRIAFPSHARGSDDQLDELAADYSTEVHRDADLIAAKEGDQIVL